MLFTPDSPEQEAMRRYIAMTIEKRDIKARLKSLESQINSLQPSLIAYLTAAGIPSLVIDDHQLVTSRLPNIYPLDGVTRQQVCDALKVAGLNVYVKEDYNLQSLTAYVRQLEEHAKTIAGLRDEDASEFGALRRFAVGKGFLLVAASPLTRSSYHAGDDFARLRAARAATLSACS